MTAALALVLLGTAGADEAALLSERAKAAFREDRALHARELALSAIEIDRSEDAAWRVYVRASQAAGLGPVVDAELASLSVDDPQVRVFWTWWQVRTGNLPVSALAEVASEVPEPGQLALQHERRVLSKFSFCHEYRYHRCQTGRESTTGPNPSGRN